MPVVPHTGYRTYDGVEAFAVTPSYSTSSEAHHA
ncbi:hypothetical protein SAMN06296065_101474 [Novosphingobium panipatense]|jgi:hypothetical protein|uniref:Uncharacterized protein n=1 Tax=Novosphingobium panipatense TaxID=428991 RepID=A0ABY1Q1R9_9SPHN|nr:hypothetical protein SAMN06296065_101474 [Novosphingobium panipatense]